MQQLIIISAFAVTYFVFGVKHINEYLLSQQLLHVEIYASIRSCI